MCKALEDELQNPQNVHRWRKLEVRGGSGTGKGIYRSQRSRAEPTEHSPPENIGGDSWKAGQGMGGK